jgi:integrase
MAPLFKRPKSKFWWVRIERKGKALQQSTKTTIKREARLIEAEMRIKNWPELDGGKEIPTVSAFTKELWPYWRRELKENTRRFYVTAYMALCNFDPIANAKLSDITPRMIEAFKTERHNAGIALPTVQHSLRALRRALNLAVDVFDYKFTPVKIRLRKESPRKYVLSEENFQRVIAACGRPAEQVAPAVRVREGSGRETMQALLTVCFDCGLRAGEATRLEWSRVNLEEGWLYINEGKSEASRRKVGLTSRVVTVLSALKANARPEVPYVFTRHNGHQPLTVGWASHEFGRIRKSLGLPDGCVLHSLRHSCASEIANAGANTGDLMTVMGWESAQIAKRYTHTDEARLRSLASLRESRTPAVHRANEEDVNDSK